MRPLVLLASIAVLGACSSSPEWVASSASSLCTSDEAFHCPGSAAVDVVIVVDDAPSTRPSRSMLRARTLAALARRVTGDRAAHDLHVLVRGASTSYERRMTYLANTPDNAWTLPAGETRDAVAFLAECESALRDVPEGTEDTAFVARVGDLHLGEDFLRKDGRVVVLFATAHDDSGGELRFRLREDSAVVDLSVLVDDRLLGSSVPSGPRLCGTFSRSTPTWDPKRPPLPRLAALVNEVPWAELSIICSDSQEAGDVLFQDDRVIVDLYSPSLRRDGCAILVAPPVFGDDARCERPELGLRPATASEHRVATAQFGTRLEGHPLCRMTELGGQGGPGEGWYWAPDSGRPAFTPWAEPVVGSFVVLHCESPRCATDTLP